MSQQVKNLHYNKPQLMSWMIMAHEEYAVWGRGTGKSDGLIAPRTEHNIHDMPRGKGVYVGATYQQILSRTLPPVVAGLERLGYKRDQHFFIGKKPPKTWKWRDAYVPTFSPEYYIHWYNGSGIHLVSQDRPGTSNGLSVDWIIGDEAKLLNKQKLDSELFPANRGNMQYFGGLASHHSLLFCTDMPTSASGKWILDKCKEMDANRIDIILNVNIEIMRLESELKNASIQKRKKLVPELNKYRNYLNELRKETVYYSEFSSLENIDVLGIDYIKQMKRVLPEIIFNTSILGKRQIKSEHGFYPLFDEEKHTYTAFDYSYIDSLNYNLEKLSVPDCRMDADLSRLIPLQIAMDYGASINCLEVGQKYPDRYRYIKSFDVEHPKRMRDVVNEFIQYYAPHTNRDVEYFYDHTAVGTDADRDTPLCHIVIDMLKAAGWNVRPVYIGQAPSHRAKYNLWGQALSSDPTIPQILFNKSNCPNLIISIQQAEVYEGRDGFQKDKRDEKKKQMDQKHTTHHSDAADTLLWGNYAGHLTHHSEFVDNIVS